MQIEGRKVNLTPPEAELIEELCASANEGSVEDEVKLKIKTGTLDWVTTVLPSSFDNLQGEGRYEGLKFSASAHWSPEDGEVITVEVQNKHLETIKELAVRADFELNSSLHDELYPEDQEEASLSDHGQEILKGDLFEQQLSKIAIGEHIISVIDNHGCY